MLIFLDVDGVLNTTEHDVDIKQPLTDKEKELFAFLKETSILSNAYLIFAIKGIEDHLVANLEDLYQASKADIILSSSWRKHFSISEMNAILQYHGFSGEIKDITRWKMSYVARGQEIKWYLEDHPTDKFVILDDDPSPDYFDLNNFINTDPTVGLTVKDVEAAKKILGV